MWLRKFLVTYGVIFPYRILADLLGLFVQREERVVLICNQKVEDNILAMANYLARNTSLPVEVLLPEDSLKIGRCFLDNKIKISRSPRYMALNWGDFKKMARPRYLFFAQQFLYGRRIAGQTTINLWHGLTYKKIQRGRSYDGIPMQADYTVAGSRETQEIFSQLFGVRKETVLRAGLPRNDWMLDAVAHKGDLLAGLGPRVSSYDKILIWMPTFRRPDKESNFRMRASGESLFGIRDFDAERFNRLLAEYNALCWIKSHPSAQVKKSTIRLTHIKRIDDDWLCRKKMTLYRLLACTDALISDYSSVMIDYSLLDQPVFCLATDLEEYRKNQGLVYEDYESRVPGRLFRDTTSFFEALENYLATGEDIDIAKRQEIRSVFFEYPDNQSAKRIVKRIIE